MKTEDDNVNVKFEFPGLMTLLLVLFIGLKLTDKIDWPWIWVLSPLWGPIALVFGVIGLIGLWMFISWGLNRLFGI